MTERSLKWLKSFLNRDHFVYAPSQWEMTLQCNVTSHWLGEYTKWSLTFHWLGVYTKWSLLMEDKDLGILHSQYHCCWWPGSVRSYGISSHGTDPINLKYSTLTIRKLNIEIRKQQILRSFSTYIFNKIRNTHSSPNSISAVIAYSPFVSSSDPRGS